MLAKISTCNIIVYYYNDFGKQNKKKRNIEKVSLL